MAHAGDVIENPVTGQRLVFLVTASDSDGELFAAEGIFPPGGFAGVPHVHPRQDERFEVLAGDAAFDIEGSRRVLGAGNTIDVPRGTKHTFANAGEDEMRVRFEFRPALASTERFYEVYFAFAQQGRVNAKAMPDLLDIATVWPVTPTGQRPRYRTNGLAAWFVLPVFIWVIARNVIPVEESMLAERFGQEPVLGTLLQ